MSRIDEERPPGVSIVRRTASVLLEFASLIPPSTYEAVKGSTTPSRERASTVGVADLAAIGARDANTPPMRNADATVYRIALTAYR